MFELPAALRALSAWPQFGVYRAEPSATRPGRTEKKLVDPYTGQMSKAASSTARGYWIDATTACLCSEALGAGYGVGFSFTREDPFFFLDVDDCLTPAGWSPIAMDLLSRFQGAAVEVSHSGKGLHIIGRGTAPEPRRCKAYDGKIPLFDLYTEARFVALTGDRALGDAGTEHSPALAALVAQYLSQGAVALTDWTDTPCDGWRGPESDEDLIRRALKSNSANAAFGVSASFRDLWEGNTDALTAAYPDDHGDGFDDSRVDAALAQHLAFWTGNNCERIAELMGKSALPRDKWDRPDYLPRTIQRAVSQQKTFCVDALPPPPPALSAPPPPGAGYAAPAPTAAEGNHFLDAAGQVSLFSGCVYVALSHRILIPGGYLVKPEQFKAIYGGYSFTMDPANERVVRDAFEAFTQSQMLRCPRADTVCFRPENPPAALVDVGGSTAVNLWWPIETPQAEGDPGPFLGYLRKVLPDDRDRGILLAYMASLVQNPGAKFQWAPVLIGAEGNGKTLILSALSYAVGERYTHMPNAKDLGDNGLKFTGWLANKLFIGIEEIYTAERREVLEALKPLVTNLRIEIQGKGQDQITGDNRANIIACSNHKDAIPKTRNDRRWCIFYLAQQEADELARDGMDGAYFSDLYDWFNGRRKYAGQPAGKAVINGYLRSYAIPDELNPATLCQRAPETSSTAEAITLSLGGVEQEVMELVAQEAPGFAGGWISSIMLDKALLNRRLDRRMTPSRRKEMLEGLGYIPHPGLRDGRVNNPVVPDNGKPRLFVKKGSLPANFEGGAAIAAAYEAAQAKALNLCAPGIDASVNKG